MTSLTTSIPVAVVMPMPFHSGGRRSGYAVHLRRGLAARRQVDGRTQSNPRRLFISWSSTLSPDPEQSAATVRTPGQRHGQSVLASIAGVKRRVRMHSCSGTGAGGRGLGQDIAESALRVVWQPERGRRVTRRPVGASKSLTSHSMEDAHGGCPWRVPQFWRMINDNYEMARSECPRAMA